MVLPMLATFAEAAAHLGHRSRSTLYRLRDDGRLAAYLRPGGRGGAQLLELEPPDAPSLREWVAGVVRPQAAPAAPPPAPAAVAALRPADLAAVVDALPEDAIPALDRSRSRREHYAAELARLEVMQRRGELVPVVEVRAEAFNLARSIRDALLALPDRLAPMLAATSDTAQCHRLLGEELRVALRGLSDPPTG